MLQAYIDMAKKKKAFKELNDQDIDEDFVGVF